MRIVVCLILTRLSADRRLRDGDPLRVARETVRVLGEPPVAVRVRLGVSLPVGVSAEPDARKELERRARTLVRRLDAVRELVRPQVSLVPEHALLLRTHELQREPQSTAGTMPRHSAYLR